MASCPKCGRSSPTHIDDVWSCDRCGYRWPFGRKGKMVTGKEEDEIRCAACKKPLTGFEDWIESTVYWGNFWTTRQEPERQAMHLKCRDRAFIQEIADILVDGKGLVARITIVKEKTKEAEA